MGMCTTNNQLANFIKRENLLGKSVLELGFLRQDNMFNFKKFCLEHGASFYRSNVENNDDIDIVWDLHEPFPKDFRVQEFDFIICSSVMEHVAKPWIAAKNIEKVIKLMESCFG